MAEPRIPPGSLLKGWWEGVNAPQGLGAVGSQGGAQEMSSLSMIRRFESLPVSSLFPKLDIPLVVTVPLTAQS